MAITFVNGTSAFTNGSSSLTVSTPTGHQAGDYLVAFVMNASTAGAMTPPTGWTLGDGGSGVLGLSWYYKVDSGSEPASYTWTLASQAGGVILACYRGVARIDVHTTLQDSSADINGRCTVGPVTTTTAGETVLAFFGEPNSGQTWQGLTVGYSWRTTGPSNTVQCGLADGLQASTGSTGQIGATGTVAAGAQYSAALVALIPAGDTVCMIL